MKRNIFEYVQDERNERAAEIFTADPEQKKKCGRPKTITEETRTINVAVPVSVLDKIEIAKVKYQSNLTKYVNHCITADLDAHFDEYVTIYNMINN